jgi:hypothetical protein
MFKCEFCDKELKSKAGLVRHEKSCNGKVVELELCSDDNDYYQGHPRRLIKLEGMLTRTTDENERIKIIKLILELRNENS